MSLSEEMQAAALELIGEFGRGVTFEKVSKVPADLNNPHRGSLENKTIVAQSAVFIDFTIDELSGDRTLENQKKLLTPHIADTLEDFNFVVDGSKRWKIKNVKTVKPGNTPILYEMRLAL